MTTVGSSEDTGDEKRQTQPSVLNREICALLSDGMWVGSRDLAEIDYVNPAFEKLWECAAQDVYESPELLLAGVHPDDRESLMAVMANETGAWTTDFRVVRSDGSERSVEVSGFSVVEGDTAVSQGALCRDVSDLFEGQVALAKSEALLAETALLARVGGWELDAELSEPFWTKPLFDIFEVPEGELPSFEDRVNYLHPDDRPRFRSALQNAVENGQPYDMVMKATTARGNQIHVRTIGQPIFEDGKVVRLTGFLQDITPAVESQEALAKSEALLAKSEALSAETGQLARLGGWEVDLATSDGVWTRPLFEILEVPDGEVPPVEDRYNFYHPDDQPRHRAAVQNAIENGVPFDLELRAFTAKGKLIHVRLTGRPDFFNGEAVRLWGSFQDITERVESQTALAKSEAFLAETGRMALVGGWELDVKSSRVVWTKTMFDIVGRAEGEIPTMDDGINFFHPEDRATVQAAVQEALQNGVPYDLELRAITSKGTPLRVRTTGQPVLESTLR